MDALAGRTEDTNAMWETDEEQCGLPRAILKQFAKDDEREKLKTYLRNHPSRECRGRKRCWKRFESQDTGCRLAKGGGKKKTKQRPYIEEMEQVRAWAGRQQEMGHELSAEDLVDEFRLTLESTVFELEDERDTRCGDIDAKHLQQLEDCKKRVV